MMTVKGVRTIQSVTSQTLLSYTVSPANVTKLADSNMTHNKFQAIATRSVVRNRWSNRYAVVTIYLVVKIGS